MGRPFGSERGNNRVDGIDFLCFLAVPSRGVPTSGIAGYLLVGRSAELRCPYRSVWSLGLPDSGEPLGREAGLPYPLGIGCRRILRTIWNIRRVSPKSGWPVRFVADVIVNVLGATAAVAGLWLVGVWCRRITMRLDRSLPHDFTG